MSELLKPCWCGAPAKQKRNDIVVCSLVSRHGYAYDTEEWNCRPSIHTAEVRYAALEKAARQVIKASPKCVGKDMLLALAELDTVLAEAQEGGRTT